MLRFPIIEIIARVMMIMTSMQCAK